MRYSFRSLTSVFALAIVLAGWPTLARAQNLNGQGMNLGGMQQMPTFGQMASPSGAMFGASQPVNDEEPAISISDSYVTFIDSAVPRNLVILRYEALFNNRQPMRAEYYHPKGGLPGATGFPFVETRIDYQELTSYAEYSFSPWFSLFFEAPYRLINPEINANRHGASDLKYGLKLCTWSDDNVIATILLRIYQPTARFESLGTGHWSIEPGLLANIRLHPMVHLEGEFRYWLPLGGTDFSGDLLRYGAGISYGEKAMGAWYVPVAECVGWSVLAGKTMTATSADSFIIEDARKQTIINAYFGMRFGFGQHLDFYAGYGRSLTGDFWQRDIYRFEMRFCY
jgi:hypothetical protein